MSYCWKNPEINQCVSATRIPDVSMESSNQGPIAVFNLSHSGLAQSIFTAPVY